MDADNEAAASFAAGGGIVFIAPTRGRRTRSEFVLVRTGVAPSSAPFSGKVLTLPCAPRSAW